MGELLGDMDKHQGGRPTGNPSHDVTSLKDLGIERMQSHRYQRVVKKTVNVYIVSSYNLPK